MSAIPRLGSDASVADVTRELQGHGAVIIERLAPPEWCDELATQFAPWSATTPYGADGFTEANGATRVVPDSHRLDDGAVRELRPADTLPAEMPRGSVVLYLGSTVHGGGANSTDRVRTGLNVDYVLGWLRQEGNQYLTYALGYIDGGRDPMTLLGHDVGAGQRVAPA